MVKLHPINKNIELDKRSKINDVVTEDLISVAMLLLIIPMLPFGGSF